MSERLPRYDGSDDFTYTFLGELVPAVDAGGADVVIDRPQHRVRRFRARVESEFQHVEEWTHESGRVHWRVRDAADTVSVFGRREDGLSRIADPADPMRVSEWRPDLQCDADGNAIRFDHVSERFDGVDAGAPEEAARVRRGLAPAQRYLKRIRWGNTVPMSASDVDDPQGQRWAYHLVFDYGDHDPAAPGVDADRPWSVRPDAFSRHSTGFDVRTWRLCRRLLLFHEFEDLGNEPVLVAAYELQHDLRPTGSLLSGIVLRGYRHDGGVQTKTEPPLAFSYTEPRIARGFEAAPASTQLELPSGLDGTRHRWLDLKGEGLPGILVETRDAWYFKRNLGAGRFDDDELVMERPAYDLGNVTIQDFDGDGDVEITVLGSRGAGYYAFDRHTSTWGSFTAFDDVPHLDSLTPSIQWIDLTGDGRPDLLMGGGGDHLTWFRSRGREGYDAGVELQPFEGDGTGTVLREDADLDTFFADMTGDGLIDHVIVRNGQVVYRPNLGYGRFGAPVTMSGAPRMASEGRFDAARVFFVDLDGTGTADLLYLGDGEITAWRNLCGNGWSEGERLEGLPYLDTLTTVRVLDFRGDGTPCLVWSNPRPGDSASLRYLPLTDGVKAGLLTSTDNGMGLEHRMVYGVSASHYLRDADAGRAWLTRLPTHVVTVDQLEIVDHIGGTRLENRYEYHDGAYDGRKRRFLGFGCVDVHDRASHDNLLDIEPAPSCVRVFTHLGPQGAPSLERAWRGDPLAHDPSPLVIDGTPSLDAREIEEVDSAIAGRRLREEVFAVEADGSLASIPLHVSQTAYLGRRIQQGKGERAPVFGVWRREQLTHVYDGSADDPRIEHDLILERDEYGVETLTADAAYRRRPGAAIDDPQQASTLMSLERRRLAHIESADALRLSVVVEHEGFAFEQPPAPVAGVYGWQELRAAAATALNAIVTHDAPASPNSARRTAWVRTLFWRADGSGPAPLGEVTPRTRVHHVETAVFSAPFAGDVYGARADDAHLRAAALLHASDGHWWQSGEVFHYGGAAVFRRLERLQRVDGGESTFVYDDDSLFVIETRDPVGNSTVIDFDHQTLEPRRIVDANGNATEVAFDAIGRRILSTWGGDVLDDAGVSQPYGFAAMVDLAPAPDATIEAVLADPAGHLQGAASAVIFDPHRWRRQQEPPMVIELIREGLEAGGGDGPAQSASITVTATYFDGYGRTLQQKVLSDPGPAITRDQGGAVVVDGDGQPVLSHAATRWLTSGCTHYNAKQLAARRYEPYFASDWRYESDGALREFGAAHVFHYDAIGRQTRHDRPDGSYSRVVHGAWSAAAHDPTDTVADSGWRAAREAASPGSPDRHALDATLPMADTPQRTFFDVRGRAVLEREESGEGQERVVRTVYSADDEPQRVIDARGLDALVFRRDMMRRAVTMDSMDGGERAVLIDALGRTVETWNAAGVHTTIGYDLVDRRTFVDIDQEGDPTSARRVREYAFGDDGSLPDASQRNARGLVRMSRDEGGVVEVDRFTPSGDPLSMSRRVLEAAGETPDWGAPVAPALTVESYETRVHYDAIGRPMRQRLADGSVHTSSYGRAGGLTSMVITTEDGQVLDQTVFEGATFNPRGQRERLTLGAGVEVSHEFDPDSWRTTRIRATRQGGDRLRDVEYTYDPVGDIVHSIDHVQAPGAPGGFLAPLAVSPERRYRYDGFHQLREATGRVHRALLPGDHRADAANQGSVKQSRRAAFNDGGQLERYRETFTYDLAGNMTSVRHLGTQTDWTHDRWVSGTSNRSLPALDANGLPVADPEAQFGATGNCVGLPGVRSLQWDHRDMPLRAVIIDRSAAGEQDDDERYLHDETGSRVRKIARRLRAGGVIETTDTLYLDGCEIKRVRRDDTPVLERRTTHVSDGLNRVALIHRWALDVNGRETDAVGTARVRYPLTDHLGSSMLELDEAGQVITYEEYLPYGGTAFIAGDRLREVEMRVYRYAGKERDDGTGLYYFGHRYFAPWMGRWLSPDPSGPVDGLNLYAYARNNPISNVDPDGLQSTSTRGREITIAGPTPADVNAAFDRLPKAEQARLRNLMKAGNFSWFYDDATKQVHFGTKAEIRKRVNDKLKAGKDVGHISGGRAPPASAAADKSGDPGGVKGGKGDAPGTRRGNAAKDQQGSKGSQNKGTPGAGPDSADGKSGAKGPGGGPGDSNGTGTSGDTGGNEAGTGDGADGGDGSEDKKGSGSGIGGEGPGANAQSDGSGTGGGGTSDDSNAIGNGDSGDGRGAGAGEGDGEGDGTEDAGDAGSGGRGGRGSRPGSGTRDGGRAGGNPNGSGTASTGGPGGKPGGSNDGVSNGVLGGKPGTGESGGSPLGTRGMVGDPNGQPGDGEGTGAGKGGTGKTGRGEKPGGEKGGGRKQPATVMDKVVKVAGWWNLEFGGDDKKGESGGIPGGFGSHNLGGFGQALYVALAVVDVVLTVVSLGGYAAIKTGLKVAFAAGKRLLSSAVKKIATKLAKRKAAKELVDISARATFKSVAKAAGGKFKEWFFFWKYDLGGLTSGTAWSKFGVYVKGVTVTNDNWAAKRYFGAIAVEVHERFHQLMTKVPFWWKLQRIKPGGKPVGAVLNWAEETAAYALGHAAVLRPHGVLAAPYWAFKSVRLNFGGGASGAQAVRWAAGELALIGGGLAAYFGLRDSDPPDEESP